MLPLRHMPAILGAAVLAGAAGWAFSLWMQNQRLVAENASLRSSIAVIERQAAQDSVARKMEKIRADNWKNRAAVLTTQVETLLTTGDFPDAALDPALAALLNRLRGDHD